MDLSQYAAYDVHAALLLAGLAAGFGLGLLRNRVNHRRLREQDAQLEMANKERELAQSELAAAREAVQKGKQQHADYRALVNDHFVGASDRLREFTLQYRAVYQHLAEGASALTEGFAGLEGSFGALEAETSQPAASESKSEDREAAAD